MRGVCVTESLGVAGGWGGCRGGTGLAEHVEIQIPGELLILLPGAVRVTKPVMLTHLG